MSERTTSAWTEPLADLATSWTRSPGRRASGRPSIPTVTLTDPFLLSHHPFTPARSSPDLASADQEATSAGGTGLLRSRTWTAVTEELAEKEWTWEEWGAEASGEGRGGGEGGEDEEGAVDREVHVSEGDSEGV